MNKDQLKATIEATLAPFPFNQKAAVNLLMGTAAQESKLGHYIYQLNNGPALGVFQMEPATFADIINNYLNYKPALKAQIIRECNIIELRPADLSTNLKLSIIFCRLHYLRVPAALPVTIEGMSAYWKIYYNTHLGRGSVSQFIKSYKNYVL